MNPMPVFRKKISRLGSRLITVSLVSSCFAIATLAAPATGKNPASKIYVSEITGDAVVERDAKIEALNAQSSYVAEGASFETKARSSDAMVFSNGTALFLDADTRIETRRFKQQPFTPSRGDLETEPSISVTEVYLAHGTISLCTSRLVPGSVMNYGTPLGSINVRGRRLVIETDDDVTRVSMLEGDSTVTGDRGQSGKVVHTGEQAVVQRGGASLPNVVTIHALTDAEINVLGEKVAFACAAKRTVFFDVTAASDNPQNAQITPQATVPLSLPPANTVSASRLE